MSDERMNHEEHNEDRRRHKRAARKLLRSIAEDENQPIEIRIKAAEALLNAPGRLRNAASVLKDILPFI